MADNNSQRVGDRLEAMDKEVLAWANITKDKLLRRLAGLGLHERAALKVGFSKLKAHKSKSGFTSISKEDFLFESIKRRLRKKNLEIESIAFLFARHGLFIEQGVGKGRPKGSESAARAKRPWLSPVLPRSLDDLAELLENNYADIAAATLVMSIPGILETKISGNSSQQKLSPDTPTFKSTFHAEIDVFLEALNEDFRRMSSRDTKRFGKF